MALVVTDPQGGIVPSYPAPTPLRTVDYEEIAYPSGVIRPGGQINPALIQMIAGIGAQMDPRGTGGILGRAAINYSQQQAAERAYTDQQKETRDINKRLFSVLGGWGDLSPKGQAGPTSVSMNDDNSVTMKGDLITQTNTPIADTERSNVQPTPETEPPGQRITNSNSRIAYGAKPTRGVQPTPQIYAPETPIPPVPIPRTNPQSPLTPGAMQTPGTQQQPETLPAVTAEAQRAQTGAAARALSGGPSGVVVSPLPPPQRPVVPLVQPPAQPQQPITGGSGTSLPANAQALLPTPRRRSQTMFDLRDVIPF